MAILILRCAAITGAARMRRTGSGLSIWPPCNADWLATSATLTRRPLGVTSGGAAVSSLIGKRVAPGIAFAGAVGCSQYAYLGRNLMPHHMSGQMQDCIDRCQSCQETCLETIGHCLELGGKHASADHIRTLMACAEMCATSARFMLLESPHHAVTCGACAEICEACAADCERFDDEIMARCADECRRCAQLCRQMSTSASQA